MANYKSLKTTINANVKRNGNQEITGQILNSVLNAMVDTLGTGYSFAGVATPATNPGTPDAKVFYIANGKGKYTHFGELEVTEDEVVVLYWDTLWHKVSTGIAREENLTNLGKEIATKQNALTDTDGGYGQRVAKLEKEGIASQAKLTELGQKVDDLALETKDSLPIQFKKGYNIDSTTGALFVDQNYSVSPVLNAFGGNFLLYYDGALTTSLNYGFMAYYDANMNLLGCVRNYIDSTLLAQASFVQFSVRRANDTDLAKYAYGDSSARFKNKVVTTNPQAFGTEEQEQVRKNIDSASVNDVLAIGQKKQTIDVTANFVEMTIGVLYQDKIGGANASNTGYYVRLQQGQWFKITGSITNAYAFNQKPYIGLPFDGAQGRRFFSGTYYQAQAGEEYLFITIERVQQVYLDLLGTGIYEEKISSVIPNYRYLAFSFIEPFTGMKILGTNDLTHFNLISNPTTEFIPATNNGIRDPAVIQIDEWYYIVYTIALTTRIGNEIGLCRTKDFNTWEELPNLVLAGEGGEDFSKGYCWAPDWFREGNNIYIVCGCAADANTQDFLHYIFDFNVETNSVGLGFKTNVDFIDGHIYKQNGLYYMLKSGFNLYRSATLKSDAWEDITTYRKWHYEGEFVIRKDDGNLRIFAQAVPNEPDGVTNSHMWYCDGGATLDSDFGDMVEGSGLKRVTYDKATEDYAHKILNSTIKEFWHWTIFDRNRWLDNNNNYPE